MSPELCQEDTVINTVEGLTEVNRGDCDDVTSVDTAGHPFDSVGHGVRG